MIAVKNLSAGYGKKTILSNIYVDILEGEFTCLLGKNGTGKTTFFKTLLGLIPSLHGNIYYEGKNMFDLSPAQQAHIISYVPQAHNTPFPYKVIDVVMMGQYTHTKSWFGKPRKENKAVAHHCLEELGIERFANTTFSKLSGGEKQMVLIARAMAQRPKFIAMDEPTSNLDLGNQQLVLNTITKLKDGGYGIIMNTHSPEQALNYADKVLLLKNGQLAASGKPSDILDSELVSNLYNTKIEMISTKTSCGHTKHICIAI